jgi:transposase
MRIIGFDIHRGFAEAVAWRTASSGGSDASTCGAISSRRLPRPCRLRISSSIGPHVKRVVIANPIQVRMIAHAKIKTDTIDAGVLAQLYASGFSTAAA